MKRILKIILIVLLILLILIQFIRPAKNRSESISANDISTKYAVPDSIQHILKVACNDCHSNNTRYPWYAEIQPVAWWLNNHVVDGKKDLNFSEFTKYRIRKQYRKLEEINDLVKENAMPLASFTWIHKDAVLSSQQKLAIAAWSSSLRDSIKASYPSDSLLRK
ncbi:MAG TPA: heme-binding domain-containing protein [Chitinophagaceae bacterium]|nr:heme-binding domain-containing protein [Chitinophagaceae bacterium]